MPPSIRPPKGMTPTPVPGSPYAELDDWLSVPLSERTRMSEELQYGKLPGDDERLTELMSASGSDVERIRTERSQFLTANPDFTGKNKEFGVVDQYVKPAAKGVLDVIPGLGETLYPRPKDSLVTPPKPAPSVIPPDLAPPVVPKPPIQATPRPQAPQQSPDFTVQAVPKVEVESTPFGTMPVQKSKPRMTLNPDDEEIFQQWYADLAKQTGMHQNPDDQRHRYDMRALWKSGQDLPEDPTDFPSEFQDDDHPNRFVLQDGTILDSKYNRMVAHNQFNALATPDQKATVESRMRESGLLVEHPSQVPDLGAPPLMLPGTQATLDRLQQAQPRMASTPGAGPPDPLARYPSLEKPQPLSLGQAFEESGKAFLRGIGHTGALGLKGIGILRHEIDQATIPEHAGKLNDYALFKAGTRASEMTERLFPGRADLKDNFLLTTVPQALGSSVLFYGTGALGAAAGIGAGISAAIPGAVVGAASIYEKGKDVTDPNTRRVGLFLGGLLGATEGIPIADLFRRMNTATGGTLVIALKVGTVQAIEEAVQEGVQQLGENVVTKFLFEKVQGLTEDVASGMGAGGIVGFITGAIMARKQRHGSTLEKQQPVNGVPVLQPDLSPVQAGPPKPKTPRVGDRVNQTVQQYAEQFPPTLEIQKPGPPKLIKKTPGAVTMQPGATPSTAPTTTEQRIPPELGVQPTPLPPTSSPVMENQPVEPARPAMASEVPVQGAAQRPATMPEMVPPKPVEGLADLGRAGKAITENMYSSMWDKVQQGDTKEGGQESVYLQAAKPVYESGGLRNVEDMQAFVGAIEGVTTSELTGKERDAAIREIIQQWTPEKPALPPGLMQAPGLPAPPQLATPSLEEDVKAERDQAIQQAIDRRDAEKPPPPALAQEEQPATPRRVEAAPVPSLDTMVDQSAHQAATSPTNLVPEPTPAQKSAGNYAKGHVSIAGLDISIENPQGSTRSGVDKGGKPWSITMKDHYGYIRGTKGKDKDHIDLFINPGTPQDFDGPIYVIDQVDPATGKFDEHKVILGARTLEAAKQIYKRNYAKDWKGMGEVSVIPNQDYFKRWLKEGNTKKPFADYYNAQAASSNVPLTPEAIPPKGTRVYNKDGSYYTQEPDKLDQAPASGFSPTTGAALPWTAETQAIYRKHKAALTKAEKAGDPQKIIEVADAALSDFDKRGYPDDWSRWERAMEDAELKLKRREEKSLRPLAPSTTPEALALPPKKSTITPEEALNVTSKDTTRVSPVKSEPTDLERVGAPSQRAPEGTPTEAVQPTEGAGEARSVLSKPGGRGAERPGLDGGGRSKPGHGEGVRDAEATPAGREPESVDTPQEEAEKVNPGVHDYRITDADELEAGGPKEKFKKNVAAIKVLKQLESEGRIATPDEQQILVKYVGWGGMPNAFYSAYGDWGKQYTELEALLTDEEWSAAKASTINAHYTDPHTITAIYDGIKRLGVKGGRLLEPGMGTGNFFGLIPSEMHFKKTGVELDSLTARIAKQLYQHAQVIHGGFEETALPDNFFDVTVGNVPFADVKPFDKYDPEIDKLKLSLHDYFFAKAMKKLRPGGVMAYLTSRYTMDKIDGKLRKWLAERADFLGAVRLPNTAFKGIANTEVVTDIIFLKKREPGAPAAGEPWLNSIDQTVSGSQIRVNEYYQAHPEQIMGKATTAGSMYRDKEYTVESDKRDMVAAMAKAMEILPKNVYKGRAPVTAVKSQALQDSFPAPGELKNHAITIKDNHPYQKQGDKLIALPGVAEGTLGRIRGLIALREATQDVLRTQLEHDASTPEGKKIVDSSISALNRTYDKFVKTHGAINDQGNRLAFREDPDYPLLQALEHYDRKTKKASKTDIFYKPTISKRQAPTSADNPKDALMIAVNESNTVDFERMRELTGQTPAQLEQSLKGEIFKLPDGTFELTDAYLSGNVRQKLREAQAAAKLDDAFKENVEALEKVIPEDLPPSKIEVRIGAGWVPTDVYQDFIQDLIKAKAKISYNATMAAYHITYRSYPDQVANTNTYGTQRMGATAIIEKMLHSQRPAVHDTTSDGKSVINEQETLAALTKAEEIGTAFNEWIWKDEERATRLSRIYNDTANNIVGRKFDGKHLTLPGSSPLIQLRPHQKDVIWRSIQTPTLYIAHVVGAGKTFAGAGIALEHRRLGLAKKPALAVPNHLVAHWAEEIRKLYPAANVLMTTENDFKKENRRKLLSRIATGNWDAVVLAHSAFSRIPVSLELFQRYMQKEIDALEQFRRDEADENGKGSKIIKEIEKAIKRLKTKLQRRVEAQKKIADDTLFWEQLGIDHLIVDEADLFKNLFYPTRMTRVAGLPNSDSKRAFDMFMKTRHIYELNNGRGVTFMSGTPVSNTMAEAFTVQRYLMPDALETGGMAHFDAWARMFGREVVSVEMGPTGNYRTNTRFAQFVNVPELTAQLRSVMDVKTNDDLKLDIPPLKSGKPINVTAEAPPGLAAFVTALVKRADAIKKKMVRPDEDNMLKICNDGRLAALDLRLKMPGLKDFPGSKVNVLVEGVSNIYKGVNKVKGTQLIFLDLSTPKAKDKEESEDAGADQDEELLTGEEQSTFSSVYQDIKNKLIKSGVKKEEIAFIHDAKTTQQKQAIFDKMNAGELRVLIGSTEKMGAGTNVQQRLVAVHHADCPWRPRDLEQRDGRIIRQGNMFYAARKMLESGQDIPPGIARHFTTAMLKDREVLDYLKGFEVASYRYATKKPSFDLYNWQTIESKARMISQIMSGDASMRTMEDIDLTVYSAAEMKALAADDPLTMEKIAVEGQVRKLSLLSNSHQDGLYSMKRDLARIPMQIAAYEADTKRAEEFDKVVEPHPREPFTITIQGQEYTDRKVAGNALREIVKEMTPKADPVEIGHYRGLVLDMGALDLNYVTEKGDVETRREGQISAKVSARSTWTANSTVRKDDLGAITSLSSAVEDKLHGAASEKRKIEQLETKRAELEKAVKKPFQYQEKLDAAQKRYQEILEALGKNESESPAATEETPNEITPTDLKKPDDDEDGGIMSERGSVSLQGGFPIFNPEVWKGKKTPKFTKEAKAYRALRAKQELVGFSSSDEDIEARVRAAKQGLKPDGLLNRVKTHSADVWHLVSREFEHLPDTAQFSPLRTDLLRLQKYKGIAADQVQRDLAAIIKPLSKQQYDQFEWKALLSDLAQEAKQDRTLPFGYTPEKVLDDLERLDEVIGRDPVVQQAWAKRQALWDQHKQAYQAAMDRIGFDTSKKLTKEDYFRHQVLEYANERAVKGTGAKVRTPTGRGFLQTRHGSGRDINANYVQAEFEVMAQMVYDTHVAKVVHGVDQHYNIRTQLEQEAKALNADAVQAIIEQGEVEGSIVEATLKDFRRRIGMHMGMARKALNLAKGVRISLEELADIADDPDSPANLSARGVFKAISERKAYIKDLLGKQFMTWEQLVPETHDLWQPREGNVFYMADSIPAQMAKALQEGLLEEAGLTADKLRKVMAMGNPREQYVIPVEAKATLDQLSKKDHNWFVEANRSLINHWKQLMLIAPRRVLRYNVRNLTGDGDAMFVGNPRAFLKLPRAARELFPVIFKDTVMTGEAKEWANRGGYGSTLQMQELGDVNDLKAFKHSLDRASTGGWLKAPASVWNAYWRSARLSTDYRESLMRYAAYLDYLEQMQAHPRGRPKNFGASIPSTVMALPDVRDRAFKLSNELLGAYDRVSVAGQTIRSFWIPFWSWQEVNATRYQRLVRNAFTDRDAAAFGRAAGFGAKKAAMGTVRAASFLVKLALFWSTLQAWNLMMYGDDEDELRETNPAVANRPHILFGRGEDGKIRYLAGIGALGDLLAWFGLDSFPGLVGDILHDRMTIGEAIRNSAKAPVNKLWQGITPTVKLPLELAVRESTYPDIFNPRPIQDRGDYLGQQTTFAPEIGALRGKPGKPLYGGEDFTGLLMQRTDPKGAAYSTWQGIEQKYLERMGKGSNNLYWRTPRGEALSNWSRAIKDQDSDAEEHWKSEYERLEREKHGARFSQTKMYKDIEASLRAKAPLAGMTIAERGEVVKQLDPQERRTLTRAEEYYRETIMQVLPQNRRRKFESRLEGKGWLSREKALPSLTP